MPVAVRNMRANDLDFVEDLYTRLAVATTASYRIDPMGIEHRRAWFESQRRENRPTLVAEMDGRPVGWASLGTFRDLAGYDTTAELSIWVEPEVHGRGIGRSLMAALIDRARAAGLHALVAVVDSGNAGSLAFHAAMGYVEVGRLPQVARKFDGWREAVLMQLLLD